MECEKLILKALTTSSDYADLKEKKHKFLLKKLSSHMA